MGNCCNPNAPKVFRLFVGGFHVSLVGVEQAFLDVKSLNLADKEAADALLKIVKQKNYIPQRAEIEYKAALLAEYKKILD